MTVTTASVLVTGACKKFSNGKRLKRCTCQCSWEREGNENGSEYSPYLPSQLRNWGSVISFPSGVPVLGSARSKMNLVHFQPRETLLDEFLWNADCHPLPWNLRSFPLKKCNIGHTLCFERPLCWQVEADASWKMLGEIKNRKLPRNASWHRMRQ